MRVLALALLSMVVAATGPRAEEIVLGAAEGAPLKAFAAGPERSDTAVLILHDWFGVSDFTREAVARPGQKGVRSIAVDLYRGQTAQTHDEAQALSSGLDPDWAQTAVRAGLKALGAGERPVAVVGYSMGGRIALRAAAENPGLFTAAAVIYGGGFDGIDDARLAEAGPILAVTGSADGWSVPEHAGLEKRLRGLGRDLEIYVYPGADHAFAQPLYNGGQSYDVDATKAMRNVLDDFLGRHLGGTLRAQ
ncbi:MAG: alpha/beta fold hydrolase [Pseudomonadota bacterium]